MIAIISCIMYLAFNCTLLFPFSNYLPLMTYFHISSHN